MHWPVRVQSLNAMRRKVIVHQRMCSLRIVADSASVSCSCSRVALLL
jgi:hypothetical protein